MPDTPPVDQPEPNPEDAAGNYQDQTYTCAKCGKEFVFTAGEQAFYASKGFSGRPGRCPECRGSLAGEPPKPSLAGQIKDKIASLKQGRADPPPFAGRFDKFTERAKKVLVLAQQEAQRLNHNYIGTEHLLLGLVAESDGIAAKVLNNLGVELNKVRGGVEFIIGRGDRMVIGDISLTPRAKKVIELAAEEAQELNHNYIGTEHLLLGLIREGEGIAVGVLESLGVDLQKARAQVITVVSQTSAKAAVGQRGQASPASTVSLADVTGSKDNVITCRIPAGDLEAIDALIEAGIRSTRSDAASWLIHAGIQANLDLFDKVYSTVAEIRRLREQAQTAAKDLESKARPAKPDKLDKPEPPEAPEMPDTATPPPTES